MSLRTDPDNKFYFELKRNAIVSLEQVLVSRKQMFDHVYSHRVNSLFDEMLNGMMTYMIQENMLPTPTEYKHFIQLTDDEIEENIPLLLQFKESAQTQDVKMMAKFFITRTTLVKVIERTVPSHKAEEEAYRLTEMYAKGDNARRLVKQFHLNEFTEPRRDSRTAVDSFIKIEPEFKIRPIPFNLESEVFKSNLWRTDQVRVVVFEGYDKSAVDRGLDEKLKALDLATEQTISIFLDKKAGTGSSGKDAA